MNLPRINANYGTVFTMPLFVDKDELAAFPMTELVVRLDPSCHSGELGARELRKGAEKEAIDGQC